MLTKLFIDNKYTRTYFNLIENAKLNTSDVIFEEHHIIPKSLGGTDDESNLVKLTLRQHYISHLLLVKAVKGTKAKCKMTYALGMMSGRSPKFNNRLYEKLKSAYINKGDTYTYYNQDADKIITLFIDDVVPDGYVRGTQPFSEERKQNMSAPKSKDHSRKIGENTKNRKHYTNDITGETMLVHPEFAPSGDGWRSGTKARGTSKVSYEIYHNLSLTEQLYVKIGDIIPDGWVRGRLSSDKQILAQKENAKKNGSKIRATKLLRELKTYHNPIIQKQCQFGKDDDVPDGWIRGKLPVNIRLGFTQSETQKNAARKTGMRNKGRIPWNKGMRKLGRYRMFRITNIA